MVDFDYSHKNVLITGGSSGIGLATAQRFHATGANVILLSRNPQRAASAFATTERLSFMAVDLNEPKAIHAAFQEIQETFAHLDVAVNSAAGDSGIGQAIHQFSEEEFDRTIGINLKGLWLCMKHEIDLMMRHADRPASILNISSVNGLGGVAFGALYAASKAGVLALTKSAALELATSHISVNAIVPGAFRTPLLKNAMLQQVGGDESKLASVEDAYKQFIPKDRIGDPAEIASLILWLASGEANYLIGHSFVIDGGMTSRFR